MAEEAGIDVYYPGEGSGTFATGVAGGGVCWGDFDGDGFEDLFFTKTRVKNATTQDRFDPRAQVFRNDGDGTFTDVSAGSGAHVSSWGLGCSVADYDGDSDLDLLYAGFGSVALFRNDGPFRFTNVTTEAGLSSEGKCDPYPCFNTGAAWTDLNGDGCLDVYLARYGNFTGADPGNPSTWAGQANVYYESACDGTFTDRTAERGLDDAPAPDHSRAYVPKWADFDGDGLIDVYVASDATPNSLLRQRPDGTFVDVAVSAGVADARAGMGLDFDDVDGDGLPDLYMTHYLYQHNGFYVNNGNGTFRDRSGEGDLADDLHLVGWGTAFVDLDHDGLKDVYVTNGNTPFDWGFGDNMTRLAWLQQPDGSFRNLTGSLGPGMTMGTTGRGSAWSDFDLDGDVDIVVENVNNQTSNLLQASNVTGGWLQVELRDPGRGNVFGVGAVVTVTSDALPQPQSRILHAGGSFLSQDSYRLHFGLGDAQAVDVTIEWLDGAKETHAAVPANRVVRATRGVADLEEDVLAPVSAAAVGAPQRGDWFIGNATVTLSATDRGVTSVSGVATLEYHVGDREWTPYADAFVLGEGVHVVEHRATDVAGNAEPVRTLVVRVDETPPTMNVSVDAPSVDGWLTELPVVTVTASDAMSALASVETRLDDAAWTPYVSTFTLSAGDGPRRLDARAEDAAGHATMAVREFRIDASPPATRLVVVSGPSLARESSLDVTSATRLALVADDGAGAGVASTLYRVDGGDWRAYAEPLAFEGPDRVILLEYASRDAVGHEEATRSVTLFLDNERPPPLRPRAPLPDHAYVGDVLVVHRGIASTPDVDAAVGEPGGFAVVAGVVTVAADAGQDVSGVAWTRVLVDGVERARVAGDRVEWRWDTTAEGPGFHSVTFESADGLDNVGRVAVRVLVVGTGLA